MYKLENISCLDVDKQECWITPTDVEHGIECSACLNGYCPLTRDDYLDCLLSAYEREEENNETL